MVERDDLQRSLALARSALRAPPAARARVRARLAEGAVAPSAARSLALPTSQAVVRAALWLGVGLCAGYWLGFHRMGASPGQLVTSDAEGARAAALAREGEPASMSSGASVDTRSDPARRAAPAVRQRSEASPRAGDASAAALPDERRASSGVQGTLDRHPAPLPERGAASPSGSSLRAPRPAEDTFGAELALLGRAERAIRAGEGALARSFLDELDQKFPVSSLREERAAARVLAGCAEARSSTAAARQAAQLAATRFLAHSSSMYAARVRQLCELGLHGDTSGNDISGKGSAGSEEPSQGGH